SSTATTSSTAASPAPASDASHHDDITHSRSVVQTGVSLYEVQHLLGHANYQTTERYAHLQPGAHEAVLDAWESMDGRLSLVA
ncbi:hypothetical protein ACWDZ7_37025, partial [Streptomyces sp. NPDC003032]